MAKVPGHMIQGCWVPKGNREAGMASGSDHIAPGLLGWQQGLAIWMKCH